MPLEGLLRHLLGKLPELAGLLLEGRAKERALGYAVFRRAELVYERDVDDARGALDAGLSDDADFHVKASRLRKRIHERREPRAFERVAGDESHGELSDPGGASAKRASGFCETRRMYSSPYTVEKNEPGCSIIGVAY